MKRFLIIGGNSVDKNGKLVHLPPREVGKLYKVIEKECVFAADDDDPKVWVYRKDPNVIILRPRPDHLYNLEKVVQDFEKARLKALSRSR